MAKETEHVRDKELLRLSDWIARLRERHADAPLVLGADFNLDPDAPQVARFRAATGMVNALDTHAPGLLTWSPAENPHIAHSLTMSWPDGAPKSAVLQLMALLDSIPQTPDHILVSSGLALTGAGRAFDATTHGLHASDHFGIWAEATLPRR
jgi:endonuclease/exonuclease/phosphatase family metal-dependent hydrolase